MSKMSITISQKLDKLKLPQQQANRIRRYLNSLSNDRQHQFFDRSLQQQQEDLFDYEQRLDFDKDKNVVYNIQEEQNQIAKVKNEYDNKIGNIDDDIELSKSMTEARFKEIDIEDQENEKISTLRQDLEDRVLSRDDFERLSKSFYFKAILEFSFLFVELGGRDVIVQPVSLVPLSVDQSELRVQVKKARECDLTEISVKQIINPTYITDEIMREAQFDMSKFRPEQLKIIKAIKLNQETEDFRILESFFHEHSLSQDPSQRILQCSLRIKSLELTQYERWPMERQITEKAQGLNERYSQFDIDIKTKISRFVDLKGKAEEEYNQILKTRQRQVVRQTMTVSEHGMHLNEAQSILRTFNNSVQSQNVVLENFETPLLEQLNIGCVVSFENNQVIFGQKRQNVEGLCWLCQRYGEVGVYMGKYIECGRAVYKFK